MAKAGNKRGKMLFIIEGLTMYLTKEQVAQMLVIIRDNFDNAYVIMECLCPKFVNKEKVENLSSPQVRSLPGAQTALRSWEMWQKAFAR